ncbi:DUF4474 domain-containing protein [Clostridiaceae bacterium 68-1-5]|uniref:DUF4474 domain-containing protein n=2 Tax=Suipraeoptans intestinalis TaxID=2606628 RepID=A0A6N7V4M3_9FIRM|nr:DUF4474 domain-containing protein [Suipraeoptans intestinalis]
MYNAEYTDIVTGNQYLRAMYYNPQTGSFLTEDSYLGDLMEPLSRNLYTYTENNPVNFDDPSGHGIFSAIRKGVGKVVKVTKNAFHTAKKAVVHTWNKVTSWVGSTASRVVNTVSKQVSGGSYNRSGGGRSARHYSGGGSGGTGGYYGGNSGGYDSGGAGSGGGSYYAKTAYERAKSTGKSTYSWGRSKLKEAKNIWKSWTASMEKTVKRFCTTASRIVKNKIDNLIQDKIPVGLKKIAKIYNGLDPNTQKVFGGLAEIYNKISTNTWGKLINKVIDDNQLENNLFNIVKDPVGKFLAFEYDREKDYYKTNESYGIQRHGGFMDLYDEAGGLLGMDLATKVVNYSVNGTNYRLQFWKGSYGFGSAYGGEIGLYFNTDGSDWYQTVSGDDEIVTEQYVKDRNTGAELIHNDTREYADKGDHYWNLAIKTDAGKNKNTIIQESYLIYNDPAKRKAALDALQNTQGLEITNMGEKGIKVVY